MHSHSRDLNFHPTIWQNIPTSFSGWQHYGLIAEKFDNKSYLLPTTEKITLFFYCHPLSYYLFRRWYLRGGLATS